MARPDPFKERMEETLELAKQSKDAFPSIKSWCRHLILEGEMLSPVTASYGLPSHYTISCPNTANAARAMALLVMAEAFISENCLNCSFHSTIHQPNFGTALKERMEKAKKEANEESGAIAKIKVALKEAIDSLIAKQTPTYTPPQLNVLQLVNDLQTESLAVKAAERLRVAASLHPDFFTAETLGVMALYYEIPTLASDLLSATLLAVTYHKKVPDLCVDKSRELLRTGHYPETIAAILEIHVDFSAPQNYKDLLKEVIGSLNYSRLMSIGLDADKEKTKRENLVSHFTDSDKQLVIDILVDLISSPDKYTRINAFKLIDTLLTKHNEISSSLLSPSINSLKIPDSVYYESADNAACRTISNIILLDPETALPFFDNAIARFAEHEFLVALTVYDMLINNTSFLTSNLPYFHSFTDQVIKALTQRMNNEDIRKKYYHLFDQLHKTGKMTNITSQALAGLLSSLHQEVGLIEYHKKDIIKGNPATFNPLLGKMPIEVSAMLSSIKSYQHKIGRLLEKDLEAIPAITFPVVSDLIKSLPTQEHPEYKVQLISVMRVGLKDDEYKAKFIPLLYSLLFDPDNPTIRVAAMQFLDILIGKSPQLIVPDLRQVILVFFQDIYPVIRGQAAELIATMAGSELLRPNEEEIQAVIDGLEDKRQYPFRRCVQAIDSLMPHLSKKQKYQFLRILCGQVEAYKQNKEIEDEFCLEMVEIMFRSNRKNEKFTSYLVDNFIVPYTNSETEAIAYNYLDLLYSIKDEHPRYYDLWYKGLLGYLARFASDQEFEYNWGQIFEQISNSTVVVVTKYLAEIESSIREIIKTAPFRVLPFFYLLSYFEQPSLTIKMGRELLETIADTKQNARYRKSIQFMIDCTGLQMEKNPTMIPDRINKIKNDL